MTDTMQSYDMSRLRRDNRILRILGLLSLLLAAISMIISLRSRFSRQELSRVLEAQQFVLRGSEGQVLARLGKRDAKNPDSVGLSVFDPRGNEAIWVGLSFGVLPALEFHDEKGNAIAELSENSLSLFDGGGKGQVSLAAGRVHSDINMRTGPFLAFQDENGDDRLDLGLDYGLTKHRAAPGLQIWGSNRNHLRIDLGVDSEGAASLDLMDPDGKTRATLGSTSLVTKKTGTVTALPPSSLTLFDQEGTVIFRVPRD